MALLASAASTIWGSSHTDDPRARPFLGGSSSGPGSKVDPARGPGADGSSFVATMQGPKGILVGRILGSGSFGKVFEGGSSGTLYMAHLPRTLHAKATYMLGIRVGKDLFANPDTSTTLRLCTWCQPLQPLAQWNQFGKAFQQHALVVHVPKPSRLPPPG
jgi:hypothetical protein